MDRTHHRGLSVASPQEDTWELTWEEALRPKNSRGQKFLGPAAQLQELVLANSTWLDRFLLSTLIGGPHTDCPTPLCYDLPALR